MEQVTLATEVQRDFKLVCAAREQGNSKAYADLMSTYREPLYLLLLRMTHNPVEAADLTIETFGKAFCQLNRYKPTNSFSSWLFTIGTNTCIDHIRRRRLETVPLSDLAHESENGVYEYPVVAGEPNPEEAVIRRQRSETLRAIVNELKQPYRQIVEMRYYDEMSYEEIAQALKIPLGTVKVRLLRARNLMAVILEKKGGEI